MKERIGRNARMLCPVCFELKAARQGSDNNVYLECSHSRTPYLLPSNGIGLEDIIDNTPAAARLFPLIVVGVGIMEQVQGRRAA
jgi:hypothetical protein